MDARAGTRVGAVWPCDGDEIEGLARRARHDLGLEFRGLEQHPFDAAGRRRIMALASHLRVTRISRPIAPSPPKSRSTGRADARGCCARLPPSTAVRWSIRTA